MSASIYTITESLGTVDDEAYFRIRSSEAPETVRDLAVKTYMLTSDMVVGWSGFMTFFERKRPKGHAAAHHLRLNKFSTERWADYPHYEGPDIAAGTPYVVVDYDGAPYSVLVFNEDVSAARMNEIAATLPCERSIAAGATTFATPYYDLLSELVSRGIVKAWTPFEFSTDRGDAMPCPRMTVTRPASKSETPFLD